MEKKSTETSRMCLEESCRWHTWREHTHRSYEQRTKVFSSILHTVGQTPLIKLNKIPKDGGLQCDVFVKVEFFNPGGSVKDRVALRMIEEAEDLGKLTPGCTIIESSSGNTAIGLAMACAVKGYKCVVVMPDVTSEEKVSVVELFGAKVVLTPTEASSHHVDGLITVAKRLNEEIPNSVILDQHRNSGNPLSHYDGTGKEIVHQLNGKVDMIVCGVGTGGTITGISGQVKESCPNCVIVGVDAEDSVLSQPETVKQCDVIFHEVEGIGYDFIPDVLHRHLVDRWIRTTDRMSFEMVRRLIREEGILSGGSSGAVLSGALEAAKDLKKGQNCVVVLSDGIRNYMTKFVNDNWLEARNLKEIENKFDHWWFHHTVSELDLPKPKSVRNDSSIAEALNLLQSENLHHIPIVKTDGTLEGFFNVKDLMNKIVSQYCDLQQSMKKAILKQFHCVKVTSHLGLVASILRINDFVAVIDDSNRCIGVITHFHLLNWIATKKQ